MSNRPRRPTVRALTGPGAIYGERISEFEQGYDPEEVDAYITAIEQERDEAVTLLRKLQSAMRDENTPLGVRLFDYAFQTNKFIARIEGGDNGR